MLRKTLVATIALVVSISPQLGAQWWSLAAPAETTPCGEGGEQTLGGNAPFGIFDGHPAGNNVASGLFKVVGWALDNNGVESVDILVDGFVVGRARYGSQRPGVQILFPGYPDSDAAGFSFRLDTTRFLNGLHTVTARVRSNTGERRFLNSVEIQFSNNSHNLRPFGLIEFPKNLAEVDGNCNVNDPERYYTVITGWALDAGVEDNDHGIGYVELLLDGVPLANSRVSCTHSVATGAFTNCYGIFREDVEEEYPTLKDAGNAGFRFVFDAGFLMSQVQVQNGPYGIVPGQHVLTVRAGDIDSQVSNIASIDVFFQCADFFANHASFGFIDPTRPGGPNSGGTLIKGWALDRQGVRKVFVLIDGVEVGTASYGHVRPVASSLYPGFPNTRAPGFVFAFDSSQLSDGPHVVTIIVRDRTGDDTVIGEQSFDVRNF